MSIVVAIIILGLLGLVVLIVSAPLRAAQPGHQETRAEDDGARPGEELSSRRLELDELEAQRESKYREIRDCELDYRTGKLSSEDYQTIDAQLRAEAIEILNRLERVAPGQASAEGEGR